MSSILITRVFFLRNSLIGKTKVSKTFDECSIHFFSIIFYKKEVTEWSIVEDCKSFCILHT